MGLLGTCRVISQSLAATASVGSYHCDGSMEPRLLLQQFRATALGPDSVLDVIRRSTTTDVFCSCTVGRTVVGRADGDCRTNVKTAAGNHHAARCVTISSIIQQVHELYLG
jgi:hypothetical protein